MIRINLLKQETARQGTLISRREVWGGAALLVLAVGLLFYLASRRTVATKSGETTPVRAAATPAPVSSAPQEPPAPAEKAPVAPAAPAAEAKPFEVSNVSIEDRPRGLTVSLRIGPGEITYKTMKLENPNRLVVDLPKCRLSVRPEQFSRPVRHPTVKRVRIGQFQLDPPITRLVFDVASLPRYEIGPHAKGLEIRILDGQQQ